MTPTSAKGYKQPILESGVKSPHKSHPIILHRVFIKGFLYRISRGWKKRFQMLVLLCIWNTMIVFQQLFLHIFLNVSCRIQVSVERLDNLQNSPGVTMVPR